MAPLDDELTREQQMALALAEQEDIQERELLKIKTNAAIAAGPVAFTLCWGAMHLLHQAGTPEDWLVGIVAPIVSTAIANLACSLLTYRLSKRKIAQQEKS